METEEGKPGINLEKVLKNPRAYARALVVVIVSFKRAYSQVLKEASKQKKEKQRID